MERVCGLQAITRTLAVHDECGCGQLNEHVVQRNEDRGGDKQRACHECLEFTRIFKAQRQKIT